MLSNQFCILVCGRFHYHHYVQYLGPSFRGIYFSHRLSESMGLSRKKRTNLFIKEYLVGLHLRLFGRRYINEAMSLYHLFWKASLNYFFKPAPINLVMLHGNCAKQIQRMKGANAIVIGDAVTIHPRKSAEILATEAKRRGVVFREDRNLAEKLTEIGLADYIICASQEVKSSYISNGFNSKRIFVIPYGLPTKLVDAIENVRRVSKERIAAADGAPKPYNILCVGQISLGKGQYYLALAAKALAAGGMPLQLTFVGQADPDYLDSITNLNVEFTHIPHLPHNEVLDRMKSSDMVALLSLEDGFGMVVTEALSQGTPVVVSKYAGAAEIISRCGGGITVDPLSTEEVVAAIESCIAGKVASVSRTLPSWEAYALALEEVVSKVVRMRRTGA